jgi:S1-C subfamily serine protease
MTHPVRVLGWALGLAVAVSFCPPVHSQSEEGQKIYERTLRGTVWVLARRESKVATGTGSLIDLARRLVITNYHVVGDADRVMVVFPHFSSKGKLIAERSYYQNLVQHSGGGINARVIGREPKRDLALLELESVPPGAHSLRLSRNGAQPGQTVYSLGNPGQSGALWVYTTGSVRSIYHKKWRVSAGGGTIHEFDAEVVETQSPTNPGDSGGPLVNREGELIGVTQGYAANAQLLSLFIDVGEVKDFLKSKKLFAKLPPPVARSSDKSKPDIDKSADGTQNSEQAEKSATTKLRFAKTLAEDGKLEKAKDRFEEIIAVYPNTNAAAEAKLLLEKLNK